MDTDGTLEFNKSSHEVNSNVGLVNPVRMQLSYPQTEDERDGLTDWQLSDSLTHVSS